MLGRQGGPTEPILQCLFPWDIASPRSNCGFPRTGEGEESGFCRIQAQHSSGACGSREGPWEAPHLARGTIHSSLPAADSAALITINLGVKQISAVISQL